MTRNKAIAAYLICLPGMGVIIGLLSYGAYRIIGNNESDFVFASMIIVWGGFGLFVGVHGAINMIRIERKEREKLKEKRK